MVLQGKPEEKMWSIPSGGKEQAETFEECCIREIKEETDIQSILLKKLRLRKIMNISIYLLKLIISL